MPSAEYQREWRKKNPEKQAEYCRKWRERNPGKQAELSRKWYHEHKEEYGPTRHRKNKTTEELDKLRTQDKAQSRKYKDKRNAYSRQYYKDNLERERAKYKEWSQTPFGKLCGVKNAANRRARMKEAGGSFTAEDIKDLYATQGGRCYYCSVEIEEGYHIEHMTPLSRGGRNDVSNICLACAPCNFKKHTKTAEEFKGETNEIAICYA